MSALPALPFPLTAASLSSFSLACACTSSCSSALPELEPELVPHSGATTNGAFRAPTDSRLGRSPQSTIVSRLFFPPTPTTGTACTSTIYSLSKFSLSLPALAMSLGGHLSCSVSLCGARQAGVTAGYFGEGFGDGAGEPFLLPLGEFSFEFEAGEGSPRLLPLPVLARFIAAWSR